MSHRSETYFVAWRETIFRQKGGGPKGGRAQNFALSSLSRHKCRSFFSLWQSSRGIVAAVQGRGPTKLWASLGSFCASPSSPHEIRVTVAQFFSHVDVVFGRVLQLALKVEILPALFRPRRNSHIRGDVSLSAQPSSFVSMQIVVPYQSYLKQSKCIPFLHSSDLETLIPLFRSPHFTAHRSFFLDLRAKITDTRLKDRAHQ